MIKFPVMVWAQSNEVIETINFCYGRGIFKTCHWLTVANLYVCHITAYRTRRCWVSSDELASGIILNY